jgi:hypothetical protein
MVPRVCPKMSILPPSTIPMFLYRYHCTETRMVPYLYTRQAPLQCGVILV